MNHADCNRSKQRGAIYEQLVRQVKYEQAEGGVQPGQGISSVYKMVKSLTINPNMMQHAYLRL